MKIDKLIKILQRVKDSKGKVEVTCGSFCGTNNGYVNFDLKPVNINFNIDDHMTANKPPRLSLGIILSKETIKSDNEGKERMLKLGYDFIPSQYRKKNEEIRKNPSRWAGSTIF